MTIKNKKELSSSIEQLEKAINQQEIILKKFDNSRKRKSKTSSN